MIDINCDMGEGMNNDAFIMPFISSANISCGYHAGDQATIRQAISLAIQNHVNIGAHPSFRDKENFGRKEMHLSMNEIYDLILEQLALIKNIAEDMGAGLKHVKPHGALYNMSAINPAIAETIARAVHYFDANLILYGLSGSISLTAAKAVGLKTKSEVFADRTYQDDGSLTPRKESNAIIKNVEDCLHQVRQMVEEGVVTSVSGNRVPILAETICVHGDGVNALNFVKALHRNFN